jgi:7,8-dihydropterin-6-yl-methyl-4-(beta-D-ribofuranosyl)aminobenzene 5'-phosphate synthase
VAKISLRAVDRVEILSLMDNYVDTLMASTPIVQRARLRRDEFSRPILRAEHGFASLITVYSGGKKYTLLFDAGTSVDGVLHNMDVLELRPTELQAIVLSHGHTDHTQGLMEVIRRYAHPGLPILLHPDALLNRKAIFPDGQENLLPPPSKSDLEAKGMKVIEERGPTMLFEGHILITGQIPRLTTFEKGMPAMHTEINGEWKHDPWMYDDQSIVINVRKKGLVVLTACSHAGLINILQHARHLTGVNKTYAVMGGFHLTGPLFEPIISATIQSLKEFSPDFIVPQHCTGWKATHEIAREFPEAFVANSVGSNFIL